MRTLLISFIGVFLCSSFNFVMAQQSPLFTDYYYNPLLINPAHAGQGGYTDISISNFGYLNDIEGSPKTLSGLFSTSIWRDQIGIGGGVVSDQIGVSDITNIFASYAYKITFDYHEGRAQWWEPNPTVLSFGLTTGVLLVQENLSELNLPGDPSFENDVDATVPSFGAGVAYDHDHVFAGASIQNLFANNLTNERNINVSSPLYVYGGYRWYLTRFEEIRIQPSLLAKFESGAPAQFDFNLSANYKNKVEIGAGYRSNNSINALIGVYFLEYWRFSYTFALATNDSPLGNSNGFVITFRPGVGFAN